MKLSLLLIMLLAINFIFAQSHRKLSVNIDLHVNTTLYDRTLSNNAVGFGFGLFSIYNLNSKLKPAIDITADAYGGTKQLFLTSEGKPIYAKDAVTTVFGGGIFNISEHVYIGATAGPAFFNSETHLGVKPSAGIRFLHEKFIGKISWTNIFQHDEISNQNFGYISFGLGIKLF